MQGPVVGDFVQRKQISEKRLQILSTRTESAAISPPDITLLDFVTSTLQNVLRYNDLSSNWPEQ